MEVGMSVTRQQLSDLTVAVQDAEKLLPIVGPDKEALWAKARVILGDEKCAWARDAIDGGHTIALRVSDSSDLGSGNSE